VSETTCLLSMFVGQLLCVTDGISVGVHLPRFCMNWSGRRARHGHKGHVHDLKSPECIWAALSRSAFVLS